MQSSCRSCDGLARVGSVASEQHAHCGDVFSREGVGCVRDEQTCLEERRQRQQQQQQPRPSRQRVSRLTLPTAPSPVTTHYEAVSGQDQEHRRRRAGQQRASWAGAPSRIGSRVQPWSRYNACRRLIKVGHDPARRRQWGGCGKARSERRSSRTLQRGWGVRQRCRGARMGEEGKNAPLGQLNNFRVALVLAGAICSVGGGRRFIAWQAAGQEASLKAGWYAGGARVEAARATRRGKTDGRGPSCRIAAIARRRQRQQQRQQQGERECRRPDGGTFFCVCVDGDYLADMASTGGGGEGGEVRRGA